MVEKTIPPLRYDVFQDLKGTLLKYRGIHKGSVQAIISNFACRIFRWPYLWLANTIIAFGFFDLKGDLRYCLNAIPSDLGYIPDTFVNVLVICEDHRNSIHFGVDPVAVARAAVASLLGKKQGGSTIEQQFVRVTLANYEPTFHRKIREQLIATLLSRRASRHDIAKAYLEKAYYGTNFNGLYNFQRSYEKNLCDMSLDEVIEITARLKYPQPSRESPIWSARFHGRCSWIKTRMEILAKHSNGTG